MSAMIALIPSTSPRSASGGRPRALEGICLARSAMFDRATPKVSHTAVTAKCFGNDSERNRCFFGPVAISSASLRISPSPNRTDPPCARHARHRTPSAVIVDERAAPGPVAPGSPPAPYANDPDRGVATRERGIADSHAAEPSHQVLARTTAGTVAEQTDNL